MTRSRLPAALCLAVLATALAGQSPVLAPTSDVTILTTPTALQYASIDVPPGVTVTFAGANPAVVRCDGDAIVRGTIRTEAGAVTLGAGAPGVLCLWGGAGSYSATNGWHNGSYGSAMPFTLQGGSPGGDLAVYTLGPFGPCTAFVSASAGGAGGGTLALVAGGRIEVHGAVRADGAPGQPLGGWGPGAGSGGSLLLVAMRGMRVLPGAEVTARCVAPGASPGSDGYVRLDSFGSPVSAAGTVLPSPMLVELPHLRAPQPVVGTSWPIEVRAPAGDVVVLALSATPITPIATPFGLLAIDPLNFVTLGLVGVPTQLVDPVGTLSFAISAHPALVGYVMHVQGIDLLAPGSPRLSNLLTATIQ